MISRSRIDDWVYTSINRQYSVRITWRLVVYVTLLIIVMYLNINAVLNHYENKVFAGLVFALMVMSYLFSIFLIQTKEVN